MHLSPAASGGESYSTAGDDLVASIEGNGYLDCSVACGTPPYYDDVPSAVFFNPTPANNMKELVANDTPQGGVPLTFDKGDPVDPGDDVVDSLELEWDFVIHVTARTVDTQNGADEVYTSRAKADWEFNGDGTVGQTAPYTWTAGPAAGNTAPAGWTAVTDGSEPDHTGGTQFNQVLAGGITWSTP